MRADRTRDRRAGFTRVSARLVAVCVALSALAAPAQAVAALTFDKADVVSDANFKAYTSMSRNDIQVFLGAMPGILKSYRAKDHNGVVKPASQIIYDASRAWHISPKVILCMLQKEQGLLTLPNPDAERIREAMGCGIYKGSTNTYPGFGNQVWHGTRKLSQYPSIYHWRPGTRKTVYGGHTVVPKNASTFALYTYNPSFHGNEVFWTVWCRYFVDPHLGVGVKPVFRFQDGWSGGYFYTASQTERYLLIGAEGGMLTDDGVAFTVNTRSSANKTPLYRLYRRSTRSYLYTTSTEERDALVRRSPGAVRYEGVAFYVSLISGAGTPVYALRDGDSGGFLYTTSRSEVTRVLHDRRYRYRSLGVVFYLGS